MDEISAWSEKIAAAAVPDEVDLAPLMTAAYLQGGKARQELYSRTGKGELGGFGVANVSAIFPWILSGIAVAAPAIRALLSEGSLLKDMLSFLNDLLGLKDGLARRKKVEEMAAHPYAALRRTIETLTGELARAGLPAEQCELIAFRTLRAMIEEPAGAEKFVQRVAKGANA